MFEKLKMFGKAYKALRAAEKSGLSREDAKMQVLSDIVGATIPDLDDVDDIEIDEAALEFFEDEADNHLSENIDYFSFSPDHLGILRQVRLAWDGTETGAVRFDPQNPFTSKNPLELMEDLYGHTDEAEQAKNYTETEWMINEFFSRVEISPGHYTLSNISAEHIQKLMDGYGLRAREDIGLTEDGQVILTPEMITVLKQTPWNWSMHAYDDEGGWPGPAIDPKRPYGDMSNWYPEMAAMLGWKMEKNEDGYFDTSPEQEERLSALHFTQLACAQAMLEHGRITF